MKHLKIFDTEGDFESASSTIPKPWVVLVEESGVVHYSVQHDVFRLDVSQLDIHKIL